MATAATVTTVATTVATVGCAALAVGNIAVGVSDIVEVVTEGYNPIRDTFLNGSQEAYDYAKFGLRCLTYCEIDLGIRNTCVIKNEKQEKNHEEEQDVVEQATNTVSEIIYGNSLNCDKTNYGYSLVDNKTGELLKYGKSIHGIKRYTEKFYNENGCRMIILCEGTKRDVHMWQHEQIVDYFNKNGHLPRLNKSFW